jgi:long-subunit fatty acid transport protein
MNTYLSAGAALLLTTSSAFALGLDRSNQDITAIFEDGNYAELSFGRIMPQVGGVDNANPYNPGGFTYDNVANDYSQIAGSIKMDVNDAISFALIVDQPFGADVSYPGAPNTWLGGTSALLESTGLTAVGRYQINDRFSVHAGLRRTTVSAEITLGGAGYQSTTDLTNPLDGLNGYNVQLGETSATGWLVGAAYEIPDIAFRLAVTYNSAMDLEFPTVERIDGAIVNPGSITEVQTPEALNIDFQTGIAQDTLLFANIRHARYADVIVSPAVFAGATGGGSLTDIDTGTSYNVGVGRRFTDNFSASVSVGYEAAGDSLVSPLAPTNGNRSIGLGAQYTMGDVVLSGGARYTWLGDAQPATGGAGRAEFTDNTALAIGMSVGFRF